MPKTKPTQVEDADSLLDDLIEEAAEFDLNSLFEEEGGLDQFLQEFPKYVLNLWANNDRVIAVVTAPGAAQKLKKVISETAITGLPPELINALQSLMTTIDWQEDPTETSVKVVGLKEFINTRELMSVHSWLSSPIVNLYKTIGESGLTVQPTMQEARMLCLLWLMLDAREASKSGIVHATSLPSSMVRA